MMTIDFQAAARAVADYDDSISFERPLVALDHQMKAVAYPIGNAGQQPQVKVPLPNTFLPANKAHWSQLVVPDVHKIAVLRSNGIGDFIFAQPALEALRATYSQAEIVYLGLDWHAEFLANRPGPVDRVEVVPASRGVTFHEDMDVPEDPEALEAFFERMAAEKFDLAIQIHGGGKYSNPFIQNLSARVTAGLRTPDAQPLDRWVPYQYFQLEVLRYLEVAALVGARPVTLEPSIEVTENDLLEAEQAFPSGPAPLAVLNPGAGDERRRWPAEKFAAVGNALAWAGAQVVVVGNEGDRSLAESVVREMSAQAYNLAGRLSLNGLAGLLSRASVVVSNDSGPLHLANAVGAASVGIYWCGNAITAAPVTRSRHQIVISWQLICPECGLNCTRNACEHHPSFVTDISQEEVIAMALEQLQQAQKPAVELFPFLKPE